MRLRGRTLAAEARTGLDARGARVVAGGRLLAASAHDPDRDRAAARGHHEPVAVYGDDLPRRRAGIAVEALGVEDLDLLGADRRPRARLRVIGILGGRSCRGGREFGGGRG